MLATPGLHLLLAWSWRIAHPPAPESRGERLIDLVPGLKIGGAEVLFDVQGGGASAGEIRCPSHADWKRD